MTSLLLPESLSFPGPTNTGPTLPQNQLTQFNVTGSNGYVITTPGLIIRDTYFNGQVSVRAPDVWFINCILEGGPSPENSYSYAVNCAHANQANTHFIRCELRHGSSACFLGKSAEFIRCKIHDGGADCMKWGALGIGDITMCGSWIYNVGWYSLGNANPHADGIQVSQGDNYVVENTRFDCPVPVPGNPNIINNNACLFFETRESPIDHIRVRRNYFNGSGYALRINHDMSGTGPFGAPTDVELEWNAFVRFPAPPAPPAPYIHGLLQATNTTFTGHNNRWADDQSLILAGQPGVGLSPNTVL